MGVDYTAHMMFGTTTEVEVPEIVKEMMGDYGDYTRENIDNDYEAADLTKEQREILEDFAGFSLVLNGYDDSFDGFGIEGKPGKVDEERVKALFKKYNYGTPDWVSFVNQW